MNPREQSTLPSCAGQAPHKPLSSLPTPIPANPPLSLQQPPPAPQTLPQFCKFPQPHKQPRDSTRNRARDKDRAGTPRNTGLWTGLGTVPGTAQSLLLDPAAAASYRAALTPGGRRPGQQGTGPAAETVLVPILRPLRQPLCCSPRRGSKLLFNTQVDLQVSDRPFLLWLVTLGEQGTGTGLVAANLSHPPQSSPLLG